MILSTFNGLSSPSVPRDGIEFVGGRSCKGDYTPLYPNYQWHHAVPYALRKEEIFQKGGALKGFDINDPKNCVALPTEPEVCKEIGAALHQGPHPNTPIK